MSGLFIGEIMAVPSTTNIYGFHLTNSLTFMHGHATFIRPEAKKTAEWNDHAALTRGFIYEKKISDESRSE